MGRNNTSHVLERSSGRLFLPDPNRGQDSSDWDGDDQFPYRPLESQWQKERETEREWETGLLLALVLQNRR